MLRRLERDHRLIVTILDRVQPVLESDTAPDIVMLGEERWAFVRLYDAHLHAKETMLAAAARHGTLSAAASDAIVRAREIATNYAALVDHWTAERIVAAPERYREGAIAMAAAMRALIAAERRALYPMLAASSFSGTLASASRSGASVSPPVTSARPWT